MYFTYKPDPNYMNDYGMATTYRLTVHVDELPEVIKEPILRTQDSTLWYGEHNGFVKFGVSYNHPTLGHEPGYMWSSRASVFNGLFVEFDSDNLHRDNVLSKEVGVHIDGSHGSYGGYAMTLEAIYDILDEDKEIAIYKDKDDGEIRLEVCDYMSSPKDLDGSGRWFLVDTIAKV